MLKHASLPVHRSHIRRECVLTTVHLYPILSANPEGWSHLRLRATGEISVQSKNEILKKNAIVLLYKTLVFSFNSEPVIDHILNILWLITLLEAASTLLMIASLDYLILVSCDYHFDYRFGK